MIESWKDIPHYEGFYEVSNFGNVRSVDRWVWNGKKEFLRKGKTLSLKPNRYIEIHLCKEGVVKKHYVHRLVLSSFVPPIPDKPYCNHIDKNTYNNHLDNLEWVTALENNLHRLGQMV